MHVTSALGISMGDISTVEIIAISSFGWMLTSSWNLNEYSDTQNIGFLKKFSYS